MSARPFIVAIDGPAGAGKSTASRRLAAQLGFAMVDTGAIYRAVALAATRRGIALDDDARLAELLPEVEIRFAPPAAPGAGQRVLLGDEDVSAEIRTPPMSLGASKVSGRPVVRAGLLELQRRLALAPENMGAVLEGRDIGTVVFPDAEAKFFLTASPEERARRRHAELAAKGDPQTYEEVLADQLRRDRDDSERAVAPLRPAADAVVVDTSGVPLDAVVEGLAREVSARLAARGAPAAPGGAIEPADASGGREVAPSAAKGDRVFPRVYGPKECGSCRLWKPILEDDRGPIGPCLLKVRTGDFPGTAPVCERYLSRDAAVPSAPPPEPVRRRAVRPAAPTVHPSARPERRAGPEVRPEAKGGPAVDRAVAASTAPSLPEELTDMTREEFAQAIREALRDEEGEVRLAPKWEGGSVVLKPGDPGTQPKEIPLDALLHKVVMIRDRLRVLEQKINAHEKLTDAEKVDMQQYVTRCYGSLTTFNLLFRDEKDRFVGEKGS